MSTEIELRFKERKEKAKRLYTALQKNNDWDWEDLASWIKEGYTFEDYQPLIEDLNDVNRN